MESPAPHNEPPEWTPVTFPTAMTAAPPSSAGGLNTLSFPTATTGRFYSAKTLKILSDQATSRGQAPDWAGIEAESHLAWNQVPPAFSRKVSHSDLNFLGRAFGGNIIEWHIRAALGTARQPSGSRTHSTTVRIEKGAVGFTSPLFEGDEVRVYVETPPSHPLSPLYTTPAKVTYRAHLIAHRPHGFSEAPVTILAVGTSEFEIVHTHPLRDPLRRYKTLRGFNINNILHNDLEPCHSNPFRATGKDEAVIRRSSQLTAAADVRFYVLARELLGGDRESDPIVTRSIAFQFFRRAFEQTPAKDALNFQLTHSGEARKVAGNHFLKLDGAIRAGSEDLASVTATMVMVGRGG